MGEQTKEEKALEAWTTSRRRLREYTNRVEKERETLESLEREYPWLGGIKGTLRKKGGHAFDIPRLPKHPRRETPETTEPAPGPSSEPPTPSLPKKRKLEEKKPAPLMAKSKREAILRETPMRPPPAASSPKPPRPPRHIVGLQEQPVHVLEKAFAEARERERRRLSKESEASEEREGSVESEKDL